MADTATTKIYDQEGNLIEEYAQNPHKPGNSAAAGPVPSASVPQGFDTHPDADTPDD
jgi:hypothetical protein